MCLVNLQLLHKSPALVFFIVLVLQGDGVSRCIKTAMVNAGVQPEEAVLLPDRCVLLLAVSCMGH